MAALALVRDRGPRDAYIAAGALRDTVWNALTGRPTREPHADLDVVYFRADEPSQHQRAHEAELSRHAPQFRWEVVNQAWVHTWYGAASGCDVEPLRSLEQGLATWPESATAVGVRLDASGALHVIAPFGLLDLFALVVRHNPARASAAAYRARIAEKNWAERWPELTILPACG
jgi:hypothetical protein